MYKMAHSGVRNAITHPPYLVMGVGVPSIRQVLVNQGFLILGSCLEEGVQVHRLQWALGLRLHEQNKGELSYSPSPQAPGTSALPVWPSAPGLLDCRFFNSQETKNGKWVLCTNCSHTLVHMLNLNSGISEYDFFESNCHCI